MPAINLSRLRKQVTQLAEYFDQPKAFISLLHELLDIYADRSYRPGQSGTPPPLITSYNVPKPVLRHIILILTPLIKKHPEQAFSLCDALWQEPYLEFRLLTASTIGLIPPEHAESILSRVEHWSRRKEEDQILNFLMHNGLASVCQGSPKTLLNPVETWLNSSETTPQQMGLWALIPLLASPEFENLPAFYRLLTPYVRSASPQLRPYVLEVIKDLARRSPQETTYFLRQNLEGSDNQNTAWLIRHSIQEFPKSNQDSLREAIRNT
jgi:hypothetical protein